MSRHGWRVLAIVATWLVATPLGVGLARAQGGPSEYQVKAAFLFNFVQFVEWPADAFAEKGAPITIGVLGDDPFGQNLVETVRGERVSGHELRVRRFRRAEEVTGCQLLFVSQSEGERLDAILATLRGRPVLLVSDIDGFAGRGGMIGMTMEQGRVKLQINPRAARAAHLALSSKLLRVAELVEGGAR